MPTQIKCPKCQNEIEITEAIKGELEAKILQETTQKHQAEIKELQDKQAQLEKQKQLEITQITQQANENARKEAIEKVRKEFDAKIASTKEESAEREKQNAELQKQVSELIKQLRESKDAEGKMKITFERQLLDEQEKIKQNAKKEAEDEMGLKLAQKDKQLADIQKELQDAQRKAQQGSQQLQGEVQEILLEDQLKQAFIYDEISEVPKGINGADIIQTVKTTFGVVAGVIVWESKNTKAWMPTWIAKLKEDTRTLKADISILVSNVLPEGIKSFGQLDGVWICDMQSAIPLAGAMREKIIAVRNMQEVNQGRATKAEIVYQYLTSNDFKQRIEVWIEYFRARKDKLEKEKAYFTKKWEKEDKNIMKVMQNTSGMYGDLQGLVGTAFPKIGYLELEGGEVTDGANS